MACWKIAHFIRWFWIKTSRIFQLISHVRLPEGNCSFQKKSARSSDTRNALTSVQGRSNRPPCFFAVAKCIAEALGNTLWSPQLREPRCWPWPWPPSMMPLLPYRTRLYGTGSYPSLRVVTIYSNSNLFASIPICQNYIPWILNASNRQ